MEKRIRNIFFLKDEAFFTPLFFLLLSVFICFKAFNHLNIAIFDIEEFLKIRFIFHAEGLRYFLPGQHEPSSFFGHPGLNNFLYYLFSQLFGASLFTVRIFCLLMASLCCVAYFMFLRLFTDGRTALFAAGSILCLPMFNVQSVTFLNELGSFFFVFASLYFYAKKNFPVFALFGICAVLYLESAVAYYLFLTAYGAWKGLKTPRVSSQLEPILFSLLPILALGLFFLWEKQSSGSFSNHNTVETIVARLSAPGEWISGFYYKELLERRWLTLAENIPLIYTGGLGLLMLFHFTRRKKWPLQFSFYVQLFPFLMQLFFFSFLSTSEGGRDFYSGFFLMFFYFNEYGKRLKFGRPITLIALCGLFAFGAERLTEDRFSSYQTTFEEYEGYDQLLHISEIIEENTKARPCVNVTFTTTLFCKNFFRLNQGRFEPADEEDTSVFTLVRTYKVDSLLQDFLEDGYTLRSKKKIDTIPYFPFWILHLDKT